MPDKNQHKVVVWIGVVRDTRERITQLCRGGLRSGERRDVRGRSLRPENAVEIICGSGETLFIIGLAAKAGNNDDICSRPRRKSKRENCE